MGEDNPTFEGLFEFCSISAGGSIGASINHISHIFVTYISATSKRRFTTNSFRGGRHCDQLGWRASPRQEARGLRVLLCKRHRPRYLGASTHIRTRLVCRH